MSRDILLIDKDPAIIDVISLMLEAEGYNVLISQKPFNINEVKHHKPILILLHNGINDEGIHTCGIIKSDSECKNIPIIMSSTRPDLPEIAKNCGVEAYIQKPFDIDDFLNLINKTIESASQV